MTIEILLATYNGGKYLEPLLNSIFEQTYSNFKLIARDDLSTDNTLEILSKYPITVLKSCSKKGPTGNFGELLAASTAPYVMFCDQDDLWHPNKIEISLEAIKESPCIVHTDLRVVNNSGEPLAPSFWKYAHLDPRARTLNRVMIQNNVSGCTTLMNRALVELALPIPPQALMHDWWLAMVASAFGEIVPLPQTTIDYRQHSQNTLGAQKFVSLHNLKKLLKFDEHKYLQIQTFYERYKELLTPSQKDMILSYLDLPKQTWLKKRFTTCRHRFFHNGYLRTLASLVARPIP